MILDRVAEWWQLCNFELQVPDQNVA